MENAVETLSYPEGKAHYKPMKVLSMVLSVASIAILLLTMKRTEPSFLPWFKYVVLTAYGLAFILRMPFFKGGVAAQFFKTFFWTAVVLFSVILEISNGDQPGAADQDQEKKELPLQLAVGAFLLLILRSPIHRLLTLLSK